MPSTSSQAMPLMDPRTVTKTFTGTLLPYQQQGLHWMLGRERQRSVFDEGGFFWEKKQRQGATVYWNSLTNSTVQEEPAMCRGGVLADEMGLGKTIQVFWRSVFAFQSV